MLNTGGSLLSHPQIPPVPEKVYPSWIKLHKLEDLINSISIIQFQLWRVFHLAASNPSLGNGHIKGPQRKSNRRSGQPNLDKPARLIIRLLFGFGSDSVCQAQQKLKQILRRQCCLLISVELITQLRYIRVLLSVHCSAKWECNLYSQLQGS